MAHFAKISGSNNIVTEIIVAEQDFINSGEVGDSFLWVQTSYNSNFRKRYAGVGDSYDKTRDAFIPPQPQNFDNSYLTVEYEDDPVPPYISNYFAQNPSGSIPYILNEDSCLWELSGSGS